MEEKTAFEHTMEAIDRAKQYGYSFDIFLASLNHDNGKGVTPKYILPKHHGHEIMSYAINKKFVKQHRFTAHQNELIVEFAKYHMRFHSLLQIKSPVKLVRFYRAIKKNFNEMILAANTDHELNAEQLKILINLHVSFGKTKIEIPKEVERRGTDSIKSYVEQQYVQSYLEISKK